MSREFDVDIFGPHHKVSPDGVVPAYIGGHWVTETSEQARQVFDPSNGQALGQVASAGSPEVADAVERARVVQPGWWQSGWQARAAALHEIADALDADAEAFASLDARNGGIAVTGARRDVSNSVNYFRYFASLASELKGQTLEASGDLLTATLREPYGVVGRIVPFNHPLQFAAAALAAPLAAGNAVLLKPAEQTPLSALRLAGLLDDHLPKGLVSILPGGSAAGSALVAHPDIPRIGFTGSVATGRAVMRQGAEHIKVVTLELGGKNPMIVGPDVSATTAAQHVLQGMNLPRTAGQSCGSATRVYLHESNYDQCRDAIVEAFRSLRVGPASDEASQMGPLVSAEARDRVLDLVDGAADEGATVLCGGRPAGLPEEGYFVLPTVVEGLADDATLTQVEAFGPVVGLYRWQEEESVLARANALPLGLTATVVTNDLALALRLSQGLEAGYVWVNGRRARPLGAAFGGYKQSGLGEENSLAELLSFTRSKTVNVAGLEP